jgi:hypothetical protein
MLKDDCCEQMRAALETLRQHGVSLNLTHFVCSECSGSGEIGLSDGEISCPVCGGSGEPLKPGIFKKTEHKS